MRATELYLQQALILGEEWSRLVQSYGIFREPDIPSLNSIIVGRRPVRRALTGSLVLL